jgi:hypothetical protein
MTAQSCLSFIPDVPRKFMRSHDLAQRVGIGWNGQRYRPDRRGRRLAR